MTSNSKTTNRKPPIHRPFYRSNPSHFFGTIAVVKNATQRERDSAALRRQADRDQVLSNTLQKLLTAERPEGVLDDVYRKVAVQLKAPILAIYLRSGGRNAFCLFASDGLISGSEGAFENWMVSEEFTNTQATWTCGAVEGESTRATGLPLDSTRIKSYILYPLRTSATLFRGRRPGILRTEHLCFERP